MKLNLQYITFLGIIILTMNAAFSSAQIFCNSNGNVIIYSNYDGGYLNIDVDQNIPNLKIGVTTYEDCEINITGTYASNVTQVIYAGYQGNNQHCNPSPATTSVIGVNANLVDVLLYPPVTDNNPDGYPYIICNYQCDSVGYQGGCNTADQIADYFLTQFGGSLYYHFTQYGCWSGTYKVSAGGDCCVGEEIGQVSLTPQSALSVTDSALCQKFCVDYFDLSSNNPTSWLWSFEGGSPATSTAQNPMQICYNQSGTYDVVLITSNAYGNDTLTLSNYITVFATPALPVISQNGNLLTCNTANSYQWQFNSIDIPGATAQTYNATQTGFYAVVITDQNGCASSSTVYLDLTGIEELINESGIEINKGSAYGIYVLHSDKNEIVNLNINVLNVLGQSVFHSSNISFSGNEELDLSHLSPATYFVQLTLNNNIYNTKLVLTE